VVSAQIHRIEYYLPENVLENAELAELFSGWTEERIRKKLGIERRPIAAEDETSADMAVKAAEKLFATGVCKPEEIDFVLFCTQSPDYLLPTSACIIQDRLGIPKKSGAFDFNLGCSGYVYGLAVVKGMIECGMARNVLFLTGETYSKYINRLDRASRPLFGDGAAATLIRGVETSSEKPLIGPFVFGTDGSGADMLIVPAGGHRMPPSEQTAIEQPDGKGSVRSKDQLMMHGPGIFSFAINEVPPLVEDLLSKSGKEKDEIDWYIFHQANKYMLDRLRGLIDLDPDRYYNEMSHRGNTVSSSIPIAMADCWSEGKLKAGHLTMLVGFGVGLSWAATLAVMPDDLYTPSEK
jgi:3-oxoacyl-[acyl-carrier-protein] synthase-3